MHGHEFLHLLAAFAEFAENAAVEFHLVNFSAIFHVGRSRGIRAVEVLVLAWSDANGPWRSDINVGSLESSVVVKNGKALIGAVADVHVSLMIHLDCVHVFKLTGAFAARSKLF